MLFPSFGGLLLSSGDDVALVVDRDLHGLAALGTSAAPYPVVVLLEIRYAFDTLHADGVGLMSNYGRVWPGDPRFTPVFDELNRRKAIVYVHPILPEACQDMMPGVGESALEYLFDTARAIASLLYNGSLLRWPHIRFIFRTRAVPCRRWPSV